MTSTLQPLPRKDFGFAQAQHLLNRAGFGGTPQQIQALVDMGIDDAVEFVVEYDAKPTMSVRADMFDKDITRPRTLEEQRRIRQARINGDEKTVEAYRRERQKRQRADRQQMRDIQIWWLTRMIESARPLEEKMALFWHGHFATGYRAIEDSYHMFAQNQFFRRHATGNFADLAHGIIRDPGMLRYLNNNQNRKRRPNENLARELMELFTLGEGNGYTENDIKQGARALTGYTFDDDVFIMRRRQHDDGVKTIFGKMGNWDGDDFVKLILERRATSEFLCLKLYRYFVNDRRGEPSPEVRRVVERLAAYWREKNYALKPMLGRLFRSQVFYHPRNMGSVVKSPLQLLVQTVRCLDMHVQDVEPLVEASAAMGQQMFNPPTVKGWSGGRSWVNTSTMFVRQNTILMMIAGERIAKPTDRRGRSRGRGQRITRPYDALPLLRALRPGHDINEDRRETITALLRFLLNREPHADRVSTVDTFIARHGGRIGEENARGALALIAAMPEFQLC